MKERANDDGARDAHCTTIYLVLRPAHLPKRDAASSISTSKTITASNGPRSPFPTSSAGLDLQEPPHRGRTASLICPCLSLPETHPYRYRGRPAMTRVMTSYQKCFARWTGIMRSPSALPYSPPRVLPSTTSFGRASLTTARFACWKPPLCIRLTTTGA